MLGFCEECRDMVKYHTKEIEVIKNIKGKDIKYIGKFAYCDECECEIFISEIRDYNLVKLDEAFRKEEGLITIFEMENILKKYDIGKRPLSLLLGWGELTLTRYLDGDIPTKHYSDTLKKILNDQKYMEEILNNNKDVISRTAYNKCSQALLRIETESLLRLDSVDKIDHVVKYLLLNSMDITPLALQKLLYYSQSFFKVFTGEYLFSNDCEAWVHGPVYKNVYFKYKNYGCASISNTFDEWEDIKLTRVEVEVLDSVIRNFGCYSGKILEKMTHKERPWAETRMGLDEREHSNRVIKKDLIKEYFNSVKSEYSMVDISDIEDYSRDLFINIFN